MELTKEDISEFIYIGSFFYPGFLLYRFKGSVFMIDQHAADERCRFEDLQAKYANLHTLAQIQSFACKGNTSMHALL